MQNDRMSRPSATSWFTSARTTKAFSVPRRLVRWLTAGIEISLAGGGEGGGDPPEAVLPLADEAFDAGEEVLRIEMRFLDHLLDRPAGAPAVVPVRREGVLEADLGAE